MAFFKGWSWLKFDNLGLVLGTDLKFYTSMTKGLKQKVRKFWGLIPTFVEVTGEKLVGGGLKYQDNTDTEKVKDYHQNSYASDFSLSWFPS